MNDHLLPKERAEHDALTEQARALRVRYEAELTEPQKRLAYELGRVEETVDFLCEQATNRHVMSEMVRHFPGFGPAIVHLLQRLSEPDMSWTDCCPTPAA